MAHILIGGDLDRGPEIRSLLRQWGMTSGRWSFDGPGSTYPTTDECDVLILMLPVARIPAPDLGGPSDAPPAPLLLLGNNPGRVLLARDAQRVLPDPGPGGVDLKFALRSCLERTGQSRGLGSEETLPEDQEGYLHFLGHELRTPLTAAKTALEVLQGELGGLLDAGSGDDPATEKSSSKDARLMMLDIALRNIKRLHRTVDWNQNLLELETSATEGTWTQVRVEDLVEDVDRLVGLVVEKEARGHSLEADPYLLRILVGQMTRVLEYVVPNRPVAGVVRLDAARERGLELVLSPVSDGGDPDGPLIARTHLTSARQPGSCNAGQELEKLAGFVISRQLLEKLQAEVTVQLDTEGTAGLVLRLVLAPQGPDQLLDEDLPAVLHASV